jgi:hypothetical protein
MDYITVKSNVENRVALWEKNPAHPGGEVFVASAIVATVALTDEVQTRLKNEFLVTTDEPPTPPFSGYDEMDVNDIRAATNGMGETELIVVRQYEALNKNRKSVMRLGVS